MVNQTLLSNNGTAGPEGEGVRPFVVAVQLECRCVLQMYYGYYRWISRR